MKLDPELAELAKGIPDFDFSNPSETRRVIAEMVQEATGGVRPTDDRVEVEDRTIPGPDGGGEIPVRIFTPRGAERPLPALVLFHGGAFVVGDLEFPTHPRALFYAAEAGVAVVAVDYRLAPEHPFPAGAEDCYAATVWTVEHAGELGIDPARVGVGGESAGGNLAAVVALMARDRGGPSLALQLLLYPVTDDRMETPSSREFVASPVWDARKGVQMWQHYVGSFGSGTDVSPYAAPARMHDLSGLPHAYVLTCESDPLRDEGIQYALRLLGDGVSVELRNASGTYHAFDIFGIETQAGRAEMDRQAEVLRRVLAAAPAPAPAAAPA
jgi:acetyl esterase/lipase